MNKPDSPCELICEKAIELGYTKDDFELKKEIGNGFILVPLKDIDLTKIREKIN